MKYEDLIPSCKKSIEEKRCFGCAALTITGFVGNPNCKFGKNIESKNKEVQR